MEFSDYIIHSPRRHDDTRESEITRCTNYGIFMRCLEVCGHILTSSSAQISSVMIMIMSESRSQVKLKTDRRKPSLPRGRDPRLARSCSREEPGRGHLSDFLSTRSHLLTLRSLPSTRALHIRQDSTVSSDGRKYRAGLGRPR